MNVFHICMCESQTLQCECFAAEAEHAGSYNQDSVDHL